MMTASVTRTAASSIGGTFAMITGRANINGGLFRDVKVYKHHGRRTILTTTEPITSTFQVQRYQQQFNQQQRSFLRRDEYAVRRTSTSTSSSSSGTIALPRSSQASSTQPVLLKENATMLSSPLEPAATTTIATTTAPDVPSLLLNVTRHGAGDGVICLNVGGTEFLTLRSTVASNSVLADHVRRAEANLELSREGAIFIDRDPCQFDIILQHLRNKVEGLSYTSGSVAGIQKKWLPQNAIFQKAARPKTYVQLPKENEKLRDLYVEATHYRIPELQAALCEQSLWVTFASAFAGGGNPFDAASTLLIHVRRGLIATGGLGTLLIGADMNNVFDFEWMNNLLGKKEEAEEESKANASIA